MASQSDKPSTTGFLCHTCVWHSRSESHELMDIDAFMRHGQRYHYLQPGQIGGYLKAAYCVTRDPKLHGGDWAVPFRSIYQMALEGERSYGRGLSRMTGEDVNAAGGETAEVGKSSERAQHNIEQFNTEDVVCGVDLEYPGDRSDLSMGLSSSERYGSITSSSIFPFTLSPDMEDLGKHPYQHPAHHPNRFDDPNPASWDAALSLEDPTSLKYDDEDWYKEALDLLVLDYELACLPACTTQLQEYMETYGFSKDRFHWRFQDETTAKVQKWERDRLQVWPQNVTPVQETAGDSVKAKERDDSMPLLIFDADFGEAGEYMNMREMEDNIY